MRFPDFGISMRATFSVLSAARRIRAVPMSSSRNIFTISMPGGMYPTLAQEQIIGRTKIDNIEIDEDKAPRKSHKSLATIIDDDGIDHDILRDNMPFGRAGHREFGSYFIGYSRYLWVIEKMLQRMFIGAPPRAYDRLLDFSVAHTGTTFFAPSRPAFQAITEV